MPDLDDVKMSVNKSLKRAAGHEDNLDKMERLRKPGKHLLEQARPARRGREVVSAEARGSWCQGGGSVALGDHSEGQGTQLEMRAQGQLVDMVFLICTIWAGSTSPLPSSF
jgi:hypothetical protein